MKNTNTTSRKNKTNLKVKWPDGYFTIAELNDLNDDFVNITLRVRLNKALEEKKVAELGSINIGKGRPKLVFTCTPIKSEIVEKAVENGVILHNENIHSNVTTVKPTETTSTTNVNTTATTVTAIKNTVTA